MIREAIRMIHLLRKPNPVEVTNVTQEVEETQTDEAIALSDVLSRFPLVAVPFAILPPLPQGDALVKWINSQRRSVHPENPRRGEH